MKYLKFCFGNDIIFYTPYIKTVKARILFSQTQMIKRCHTKYMKEKCKETGRLERDDSFGNKYLKFNTRH